MSTDLDRDFIALRGYKSSLLPPIFRDICSYKWHELALNQVAKPWSHQYLDPAIGTKCGGLFPKMFPGTNLQPWVITPTKIGVYN